MIQFYTSLLDTEEEKTKFEEIYVRYYPMMLAVARQYVDEEGAKDIVHDVMLKLVTRLDAVDLNCPPKAKGFLCVVVKNYAIDIVRRSKKFSTQSVEDFMYYSQDDSPLPLEALIQEYGYNKLVEYIDSLSDTYKAVCRLKYVHDLDVPEIAEILNMRPNSVSVKLCRARQILREKIRNGGEYDE